MKMSSRLHFIPAVCNWWPCILLIYIHPPSVESKIIQLDLVNLLEEKVICTVHYFQAIVDELHFLNLFLSQHQPPSSNAFAWTISHSTRFDTNHVENYTALRTNNQLLKYVGFCSVVILMKVRTLFGWYPDIIPNTPSLKPTLVLAFWEYNYNEDKVIRHNLGKVQRYVLSMARNNQQILLFTYSDKTFTAIKRVELLCYYCPGALIEYSLQELVLVQPSSGNGIVVYPLSKLRLAKLVQDNRNLHGKPEGVLDSTLEGLSQDFNFNALRRFKLGDKLKFKPFLNVINEMVAFTNFTPILLNIQENETEATDVTNNYAWIYKSDKIWCDFLDVRIVPVHKYTNMVSVKNVFKRVIYCEHTLIIKSQVKRFALWLTPFDSISWIGIMWLFAFTWICTVSTRHLLIPEQTKTRTSSMFEAFPLIYTLFRKTVYPNPPDRIHITLLLGYFVIISGYEAVITSRVIAPETPYIYDDYVTLFESGFKLYCYLIRWKAYEEHRDILEIVVYLNSTERFKKANLTHNKWWIKGIENIMSESESNLSKVMSENKLALPISDSFAQYKVLKLTKESNSSKYCHLIPPKIQTGREVWLFEGSKTNSEFLMKTFERIFESGIPSLFYTNYNWLVHEISYERDLVASVAATTTTKTKVKGNRNTNEPKALSLGGKWTEIFFLCALGILAGGFTFTIERYLLRNISKKKNSKGNQTK